MSIAQDLRIGRATLYRALSNNDKDYFSSLMTRAGRVTAWQVGD